MIIAIILGATSFGNACDVKQMERQRHRTDLKQQRFLAHQGNIEPFCFSPRFKGDTLQARLMLGLMIGACIVGGAEATNNKPPSSKTQINPQGSNSIHNSYGSAALYSQPCVSPLDLNANTASHYDNFRCMNQAQDLRLSQATHEVVFPNFVQDFTHPGSYTQLTGIKTLEEVEALLKKDYEMAKKEEGFVTPTTKAEETNMLIPRWRKLYKSYGPNYGKDEPIDRTMAQKAYNFATKTLFPKPLEKWQLNDLANLNKFFTGSKLVKFRNAPVIIRNSENDIPGFFEMEAFEKYLSDNNPTDVKAYYDLARDVWKIAGDNIDNKDVWHFMIEQSLLYGSPHNDLIKKYYSYNDLNSSEIKERMETLLIKTKKLFKKDGIKAAEYFHMELVNIHPWDDANGRVARIGLNLILIKSGYPAIAFTSDNPYTSAINKFNAGNKTAFKRYIQEEICRTTRVYNDPEFHDGQPFEELVEKCKIEDCEQEFENLRKIFDL